MYGQYHPLPYQSKIKEKFITFFGIGLSFSQSVWWAVGGILSYKMAQIVPRIGDDWFYSRLHYAIPFAVCLFLCHSKHGTTGLPIWKYYWRVIQLHLRQREFMYLKMSNRGDR